MLPRIKRGMKTFMGCDVGEVRAGYRIGTPEHRRAEKLASEGLLNSGKLEGRHRWYSLTQKGKDHLTEREAYRARL